MNSANRQPSDVATPGIIMRPPRLYLACLLVGLALDRALPLPLDLPGTALMQWIAGAGLILIGGAIFAAGVRNFSRAATPVPGNQPVRALVAAGIHGWSRNPIYVGMSLVYAGIGIAARSPWVFILALPLAIVMRYVVVAREEAYLERRFGDAYRDYMGRVPRWLSCELSFGERRLLHWKRTEISKDNQDETPSHPDCRATPNHDSVA